MTASDEHDAQQVVLMLGWDPYLIRGARRLGLTAVVVIDHWVTDNMDLRVSPPNQVIVVDDCTRLDVVLGGVERSSLDPTQVSLVTTTDEYAIVTAAALSDLWGCRGTPYGVALRMRDKWIQKTAVREGGIAVPEGNLIEDVNDLSATLSELPFTPAVCKPLLGGGTESTFRVETFEDLEERLSRDLAFHRRPSRQFMLEELQQGAEYHVNGIVREGRVAFWQIFSYGESCLDKAESNRPLVSVALTAEEHGDLYRLVEPVLDPVFSALGYSAGVFHLEVFIDEAARRVSFGECAARRGGGLIQEAVHASSGVDLAHEHLRALLDLGPPPEPRHPFLSVGYGQLPAAEGLLLHHPSREELEEEQGVRFAALYQQVGQTSTERQSNTIVCLGDVLAQAEHHAATVTRLERVQSWFSQETVTLPPDIPTAGGLRQWRARLPRDVRIEAAESPPSMFEM